jgi:hypothetical protein
MPYTGEETNKKLGALIVVTEKLVESREEEQEDASSAEPGMVDSEGNKLVLSKAGNLMQAGADGKATVMSPIGATSKIPNIPSMALPRMGDAGRAGQAEDDAEGTTEPDEEKRNSLLSKMTGFLGDQAKEKGKIAKLGLKAFFGTLVFGGFLIALGKFLQSDTFKKVTEFIDKTLIPKLKTFYDAFFGPEGGLFKGIMTLFGDESGIGAIVAGIAVVTALMGVVALKALFSPLTLGLGLLFKGIRGLGRMIPRVPGGPAPRPGAAGGPAGGGPAGSKPGRTRRPRGRFGALLNIGKLLASKAKKLVTSGGAKTVAKVAGTAAVAGAALATTRAPTPPAKLPTATAVKPPTPAAGGGGGVVDKFKHLSKFPLLKKAATKIPLLGPLLSGAFAVQLLLSDAPKEEKIKGIGGLLGGSLGATGFGIIGGTLGSIVPGFGTVIGGLLGSTLGYFAGDYLGTKVASFLMGEGAEIEKPKVPEGDAGTGIPMSMPGDAATAAGGQVAGMKAGGSSRTMKDSRGENDIILTKTEEKKLENLKQRQAITRSPRIDKFLQRKIDAIEIRGAGRYRKENNITTSAAGARKLENTGRGRVMAGSMELVTLPDGTMVTKDDPRRVDDSAVAHLPKAERADAKKAIIQSNNLNMQMNNLRERANKAGQEAKNFEESGQNIGAELARIEQDRFIGKFNELRAMDTELRKEFAAPPKKANIAQNKVGPQTADLKAAIAKKLAMSGDTSTAAAATQQGGGNTQITNVSKKDGDVTHMPKSDIRNNKFAALNRSAYAAGAI